MVKLSSPAGESDECQILQVRVTVRFYLSIYTKHCFQTINSFRPNSGEWNTVLDTFRPFCIAEQIFKIQILKMFSMVIKGLKALLKYAKDMFSWKYHLSIYATVTWVMDWDSSMIR